MDKIKLIVTPSATNLGNDINAQLSGLISTKKTNLVANAEFVRFGNGEGKCVINDDLTGCDVYIISDVNNHGACYDYFGEQHHMGPDEHLQDIKRAISALRGQAARINVVMPLLYQSRQDKRKLAESLDCAMMLKELELYGVKNIITIDIHNAAVENAIPFSMYLHNQSMLDELLDDFSATEKWKNLFVVSPDSGASKKADYCSKKLGVNKSGFFEKKRNYNVVKEGQNPIEYHEFNGPKDLTGYDILLVDDMIASGNSLFSSMKLLKKMNVNNIYLMTTFSLFTNGIECFEKAHKEKLFSKLYTTNTSYIPAEYQNRSFIHITNCSKTVANTIYNLHLKTI